MGRAQGPQAGRIARRRLAGTAPLGLLRGGAQPLPRVGAQGVHQQALGLARAVGVLAVAARVALGRAQFREVGRLVHRAVMAAGIDEGLEAMKNPIPIRNQQRTR